MSLQGVARDLREMPGHEPWMFTLTRDSWRPAQETFPTAAAGAFVMNLDNDLFVLCVPAESLLRKGIALTDYGTYIGTPDGIKMCHEEGKLVWLQAGQSMWVPWGLVAHPFYYNHSVHTSAPKVSSSLVCSLFSVELAKKMPQNVMTAVVSYITQGLQARNQRGYGERLALMTEFFKKCGGGTE